MKKDLKQKRLKQKEKNDLRKQLYNRDGYVCHYCGIQEKEFLMCWGEFYGLPYRGTRLEIDRKGNNNIENNPDYTPENCVLACALCNMAKSNMFTEEEFQKVGKVIGELWQQRKRSGHRLG